LPQHAGFAAAETIGSGAVPSDPFQMAMIHRTFRNEFGHIACLVRAVAERDTKRSGMVGSYCDNMVSVLHHHHAAEDETSIQETSGSPSRTPASCFATERPTSSAASSKRCLCRCGSH
jgi:hypothetical protein